MTVNGSLALVSKYSIPLLKKALSCLDLPGWWSRDSEWISGASVALRKLFSCLDLPAGGGHVTVNGSMALVSH